MSQLDAIDLEIIKLLNEDAHISGSDIARRLGIAVRTVHHRIKRLKDGNVIRAVGVVNPRAFGYNLAVDIFCELEVGSMAQVIEALQEMPEISYIAMSTGDQDISVQAFFRDIEDMHQFITHKLHQVPGMRRTRTVLIPQIVKDSFRWLPPEECFDMDRRVESNNQAESEE